MVKVTVSEVNAEFWNELCGTNLANRLGITDDSSRSLKIFDEWFFSFYPYLLPFLDTALADKQKILEVGLGYGSVSSCLASRKGSYTGMDIALAPVATCNRRLKEIPGKHSSIRGDALRAPFPNSNFDAVVAIGSLHHTGDFNLAIAEMCRVAKSGGVVCGMVYSLFSARNFIVRPIPMFRLALRNLKQPVSILADEKLRWFSDHNQKGEAAPVTEYFSRKALRSILERYGDVEIRTHNLDSLPIPFGIGDIIRRFMIRTNLPALIGLDLYFVVKLKIAR